MSVPFKRPDPIDNTLGRETFTGWKIVCTCGAIQTLNAMSIKDVNEQIQYFHPHHRKEIYAKYGLRRENRGSIPAMQEE